MNDFVKKSIDLLTRRQTSIISAAYIIMATVILSQIFGLIRNRLFVATFDTSQVGVYFAASLLPDMLFQLTIAAAVSSAFIPVFSQYLVRGEEKTGHKVASTLLALGLCLFVILSTLIMIFAPLIVQIFNVGGNFPPSDMALMANLMRIIIIGQLLFIIGTFFTALLQSYNHFFIPGIAAATYNLGIILGVLLFSQFLGIYSITAGVILGGLLFVLIQIPMAKRVGFSFIPTMSSIVMDGVKKIGHLMWPRTIAISIMQFGTVAVAAFISFLSDPGTKIVVYDFAKTLAFAPVALIGQTIAQAAFPVLSREKERPEEFKTTFLTSFNHVLYLILPISVLILILRIPLVRLVYGAENFDWAATVLTGQTLAFFCLSIFAQALILLVLRAFYALHDTKTPLILNSISTALLLVTTYLFIIHLHFDVTSLAIAFTISSTIQLVILFILLERKVGRFQRWPLLVSWSKILVSSIFTAFALYIPIKLLDQLVFDTTRTINLLALAGISSLIGLSIYLFLTWFFDVKEAKT
ncbi:MAG TPA: murein biosynthesis integral membrane protein MurJ, partial [Patescibacteria group bacterium]|nr:murein biosynthesis integral membrane protein MurJ [Patescibacteria group bacterium]